MKRQTSENSNNSVWPDQNGTLVTGDAAQTSSTLHNAHNKRVRYSWILPYTSGMSTD